MAVSYGWRETAARAASGVSLQGPRKVMGHGSPGQAARNDSREKSTLRRMTQLRPQNGHAGHPATGSVVPPSTQGMGCCAVRLAPWGADLRGARHSGQNWWMKSCLPSSSRQVVTACKQRLPQSLQITPGMRWPPLIRFAQWPAPRSLATTRSRATAGRAIWRPQGLSRCPRRGPGPILLDSSTPG